MRNAEAYTKWSSCRQAYFIIRICLHFTRLLYVLCTNTDSLGGIGCWKIAQFILNLRQLHLRLGLPLGHQNKVNLHTEYNETLLISLD